MARDEDWLLQEIARSQSPFQSFERPDSPFSTQGDPGADEVYGTSDILRMAEARKPNAFQRGARWLLDKLPHFGETAPRQSIHEALANPKPVGFAERLADAPARLGNLAMGIPHAVLNSADKYAGGFDAALQGRHAGGGFAGTGVDAEALLVPPDPRMVMPGMGRVIAKGEASPFSTYDRIRARWDSTPPVPFFGKETFPAVWAEEMTAGAKGRAAPNHANPFSHAGQHVQKMAEDLNMPNRWPRPPAWEGDGTPASVGNMKRLPGSPANDADIGLVRFNAKGGDEKVAALAMDHASRMERARQMGFDVDNPMYHGTKAPVDAFDLRKAGKSDPGLVGRAVYGTPSGEQAGMFATSPHYGRGDAPNVMPLLHRMRNPAIVQDGVLPDGRTLTQAHPSGITKESGAAIKKALQGAGYDGAVFKIGDEVTQYAVFEPNKVRSPQAAFDPAKADSPFLLAARAGDSRLTGLSAQAAGKRSEPLPMTAAVAEWLKMSGKEPSLRLARGSNETDYVSLPHGPQERQRGLARTKVRVPDDGHPGWPEPGLIDTAPTKAGRGDPDVFSRVNQYGDPYSNPNALIRALEWATSSSPEGFRLVEEGYRPLWARDIKDPKPASPFTGTEPPSPAQPRLSESVGELWAKTDNKAGALTGREQALRRGQEAYDRGGKLSPWEADAWGDTTANKVDQGRLMDYQRARNEFEDLRPPVGAERLYPEGSGITDRRWVAPGKLNAKSGNRFTAAIAAMRLDPEKAAQAAKALEHLDGVSVAGQVKVLEQYGIPAQLSGPALMKHAPGNRKFSTENRTVTGLEKAVAGFPQEGPPRNFPARYTWAHADNRAKLAQVIKEMDGRDGYGPSTVFKALEAKHPDLAAATTRQSLQQVMTNRRAELGLSGTGSAQPHRWTSDTASAAGKASNPYPGADAAAAARRGKTTKRVLIGTEEHLAKRRELNAQRERRSQESRNAPELEKRGGKPFWDEHGKKTAADEDRAAAQRAVDWIRRTRGGD